MKIVRYIIYCIIIFGLLWLAMSSYASEQNVSIRELGERLNWNEGKQKSFILTIRYKDGDTVFCPSFIVRPMERAEDFPKDMETVVLNEPGVWLR
jgi:hypothetical protein